MTLRLIIATIIIIGSSIYKKSKYNKILLSNEYKKNKKELALFFHVLKKVREDYIVSSFKRDITNKYGYLYKYFSKDIFKKSKEKNVIQFRNLWRNIDANIKKWNETYVTEELKKNKNLLDNIDGKSLDHQQRQAVVVDDTNNLIIAGAGSGKTLTISGKVKYLVDKKGVKPEEILLISFTRKSAEEMYERIWKKLSVNVEVKTFHKLGLDIISHSRGERPDISDDLRRVIDQYFKSIVYNDKKVINKVIEFFGYYINIPKDMDEFENLGECHEYYRSMDLETLKSKMEREDYIRDGISELKEKKYTVNGERVKSIEEVIIANFLYLNGVKYIYEHPYPHSSADRYHKKYHPDFYLPEYDIYIEYFGIDKNGRTPWLSPIEEEKYLEGITWKREVHRKNNTNLLETYSFYNKDGELLSKLEEKLKRAGVKFKDVNYEEIFKRVYDEKNDRYFQEFKKLIGTFIGLFKSNNYRENQFEIFHKEVSKEKKTFLRNRSRLFLEIIRPIYHHYENVLHESGKIDFNDMINKAADIVKNSHMKLNYRYIIIDEYQDISISRFSLIKAIKDKTGSKLMCVGDDWQSIYRFAGSEIELFTRFQDFIGKGQLLKIEKTYRNSQELIDVAGKFVMRNKKQIRKNLKSDKSNKMPIKIFGYGEDIYSAITRAISEIVSEYGREAEILMIGRNNFDIDFIDKYSNFNLIRGRNGAVRVKCINFPNLRISYLTAHKSKGIEGDNVIIINTENKMLGFPNKISDDHILSLVLKDSDKFQFAEERRLFYVALTRTKNTTYIMAKDKNYSTFVDELIRKHNIEYEFSTTENSIRENPVCPRCLKGVLVRRKISNSYKEFLGCSNFPKCDYTLNDTRVIYEKFRCKSCGGYMVKKSGKYGQFYGCSNFPRCKNTHNIKVSYNNENRDQGIPF